MSGSVELERESDDFVARELESLAELAPEGAVAVLREAAHRLRAVAAVRRWSLTLDGLGVQTDELRARLDGIASEHMKGPT